MSACWHNEVHPVEVDGVLVANLCGDCGEQLVPEFTCPDCSTVEVRRLSDPSVGRIMGRRCPVHSRGPDHAWT